MLILMVYQLLGKEYASLYNMEYCEVSAKTGYNIGKAFVRIVRKWDDMIREYGNSAPWPHYCPDADSPRRGGNDVSILDIHNDDLKQPSIEDGCSC